jgi:hypothetical protein
MNLRLALLIPLLAAPAALAQHFGEPLALTEPTRVSDILADPAALEGELVQVRGTIVDVCPRAGCWVVIGEDGDGGRQITFKVEDGAMVFAPGMVGRGITAEGVVALAAPPGQGPKAAEDCGGHGDCGEAEDGGCGGCGAGDAKAAPPPKPAARLNGVGATVK